MDDDNNVAQDNLNEQQKDKNKKSGHKNWSIGVWLCLGVAFGASVFDNAGLGATIGLLIWVVFYGSTSIGGKNEK